MKGGNMSYKIKEIPQEERPRERLKQLGVEHLSNKELLAIILKTGTKNRSVTDLAIEILKKYNLPELKEISLNSLTKIKGIGEVKAIELLAAIELGKRINIQEKIKLKKLASPEDIWKSIKHLFTDKKQEYFYTFYFNTKKELINKKLLFIGTLNESVVHPREIFKEAYRLSASCIVCAHNHPSDDILPSKADIYFTEQIIKIGKIQGIPVIDHIIVGENNYYSFYENSNKNMEVT